jgi:hypothetical protein
MAIVIPVMHYRIRKWFSNHALLVNKVVRLAIGEQNGWLAASAILHLLAASGKKATTDALRVGSSTSSLFPEVPSHLMDSIWRPYGISSTRVQWLLFISFCPKCGFLEQFWPHKQCRIAITFYPCKPIESIYIWRASIFVREHGVHAGPKDYFVVVVVVVVVICGSI